MATEHAEEKKPEKLRVSLTALGGKCHYYEWYINRKDYEYIPWDKDKMAAVVGSSCWIEVVNEGCMYGGSVNRAFFSTPNGVVMTNALNWKEDMPGFCDTYDELNKSYSELKHGKIYTHTPTSKQFRHYRVRFPTNRHPIDIDYFIALTDEARLCKCRDPLPESFAPVAPAGPAAPIPTYSNKD
ncbi:MAG: hypothetical protein Hyperionvirus42_3 [Hyperionvirus sp.]|uniref:Uncharacterized protein n=1 Tax=Hyperionvirus sp. TaxID=2487770 RepID=A0A3G5ACE4_9VIRU|nr:MAG: hypothetical protein Hyperionvirus42_3 [Hyperionvirus sp.]